MKIIGEGGIEVEVVADSEYGGDRLTTLSLKYPRFIHAEFMTHRMFSRNASSSRAIPVPKMLASCTAGPIHWGKNQPGMQAREELDGREFDKARLVWDRANSKARHAAEEMDALGAHKQIVNRLTEPFQFIKVVVSATEWDNFFKLRIHEDAQPEIYELAKCMFNAIEGSEPKYLEAGDWHLPFTRRSDGLILEDRIKCSVARCARVSYMNHDNTAPDTDKDIMLHDQLMEAGHMSPFEHQAKAMPFEPVKLVNTGVVFMDGITHFDRRGIPWSGNFRGFIQYRQTLGGNH